MLENRKTFRWFAIITIFLGVLVFLISLLATMSIGRNEISAKNKVVYFDQKILPDHLLYPLLVAIDRLELKMADKEEAAGLEMDYAKKRMQAAKALFYQEKGELAFVTLGKAHQYLLNANTSINKMADNQSQIKKWREIQKQFKSDYNDLRIFMSDSQKARLEVMQGELIAVEGALKK